jgi:hypothetical protein
MMFSIVFAGCILLLNFNGLHLTYYAGLNNHIEIDPI